MSPEYSPAMASCGTNTSTQMARRPPER
jgi:hypothetical protein